MRTAVVKPALMFLASFAVLATGCAKTPGTQDGTSLSYGEFPRLLTYDEITTRLDMQPEPVATFESMELRANRLRTRAEWLRRVQLENS